MTIFKRITAGLFGILMIATLAPAAKATAINVTFSVPVAFSAIPEIATGSNFILSFSTNACGGSGLTGLNCTTSNITSDVIGTTDLNPSFQIVFGSIGQTFNLTTDAGGTVTTSVFFDTGSSDNTPDLGTTLFSLDASSTILANANIGSQFAFFFEALQNNPTLEEISNGSGGNGGGGNGGEVPEPGSLALIGVGLVGLAMVRRRRKTA